MTSESKIVIFSFWLQNNKRRNVLLRIFFSWPIGIKPLTQFGRTKKRERGRERDMRSGAFLPVLPRKTNFEVHKCEGVLIDINFPIVIIYTQISLASKKQSKKHKTRVMKHTIFFIMFRAIGTHLFMLPKQIHFIAKCVWIWLSHHLFFLHLLTTWGKACECWFFFSHQYHVNLLVFWRVSWMNDMPWTTFPYGKFKGDKCKFWPWFPISPTRPKVGNCDAKPWCQEPKPVLASIASWNPIAYVIGLLVCIPSDLGHWMQVLLHQIWKILGRTYNVT